jgi:hypothetical protein
MLTRDKHSSLLRKVVTYGRKKFYNIGHWPAFDGTFMAKFDFLIDSFHFEIGVDGVKVYQRQNKYT